MAIRETAIPERKPSILFVDDEPRLLSALKRLVRPWRNSIETSFVGSGDEALKLLNARHFDVIVSDMRMPRMSGAELLKMVRRADPESLRVVLSGQAEVSALVESLEASHRYISKPCDIAALEKILKEAVLGQFWVKSPTLRKHLALLPSLPCQAGTIENLLARIAACAPTDDLSEIAETDLGLSVKLIHLANVLLPDQSLTTVRQALKILSPDLLVMSLKASGIVRINDDQPLYTHLVSIARRSQAIARIAGQIADEFLPLQSVRLRAAGNFCLVGDLALLSCFGVDYLNQRDVDEVPLFDARRIGAFLMTLWGIGDGLPRLVAGEMNPRDDIHPARILIAAEHLAARSRKTEDDWMPVSNEVLRTISPFLKGLIDWEELN